MSSAVEAAVVNPIWDCIRSTFCFFVSTRADYFDDLEANLKSLIDTLEYLEDLEEQIKSRVEREKGLLQKQADDVTRWRKNVDRSKVDARIIINEAKEEIKDKLRTWFCPKTCLAYNRVGKRVSSILKDIIELINNGNFQIVVEKVPHNLTKEKPMPLTVGLESKFEEIQKWIEDPTGKIIGLYGTGGVGKTTLLTHIYNTISHSREFVVIWVEMPKQDPVETVQKAIFKKFEITQGDLKNKADNEVIWNLLSGKKFFLLLDDVQGQWLQSDLLEMVGIPIESNVNGSKVFFTARAKEVCDRMRAKSIEVKPLSQEDALELLELHVGQGTLNTQLGIQKLAQDVVNLCEGLPLLLITIGRAMASKTNLRGWKNVVKKLSTDLSKIPGVEAKVLSVLKVSYDTLSDETLKRCFRYFSVFQDFHNIKKEELIELWIAEGLLEESLSLTSLYDVMEEAGEEIIASLKLASLLESGESEDFVKMHDLIHSMALWLAHEEDKVLVQEKALDFSKWVSAKRISMYGARIESLDQVPFCNHLTTLLLRAMNLKKLPGGLFKNMPTLRVLDLSDNQSLAVLPVGKGELGNLNYLNLSRTSIQELPVELKNLKHKLRILIVSAPLSIAQGLISSNSSLQVVRMLLLQSPEDEVGILEELELLEYINKIGLVLSSAISVKKLSDSPKLRKWIKHLAIRTSPILKLSLRRMEHLQRLELSDCTSLTKVDIEDQNERVSKGSVSQEFFRDLSFVSISSCQIMNVTWLVYAPYLQTLALSECNEIVQVIISERVFPNLTELSLRFLPTLKFICQQALQIPSLKRLLVIGCPELRRLPFDSDSAKNLMALEGKGKWWDNLQWESQQVKEILSLKFRPIPLQKIVIRFRVIPDCDKCCSEALKIAASNPGVYSVGLNRGKKHMVVTGDEIDAVKLVNSLRKKVGQTALEAVELLKLA